MNAAHQFHNRTSNDERYILAGYPWFKCRARDTFIALPGLTLSIEEQDYFELVMQTASVAIREFIEGKPLSVKIYEMEQPDVLLWAVWAIQQYAKEVGKEACANMYGNLLYEIVAFIEKGGHPNLFLDENGLLRTNGKEKAVTWMNSTVNGRPVIPRTGYIVEFNALWYNALIFVANIAELQGKMQKKVEAWQSLAEKCKESFVHTFLNDYGYLFDYVDGNMMDWSVRPNMIFAVAL